MIQPFSASLKPFHLVSVHQDDAAAKGVCIGDEVGGNFVEAVAHVRGNAVLSSIDDAGLQRGVQLRVSDCGGGSAQSIHGVDHQVSLGHADLQALHLVQREVGWACPDARRPSG